MKLEVYDPPMCCSTGVCGTSVDPNLVNFAADLQWLKKRGVEVHRYNLSQEPAMFANSPAVKEALEKNGNKCLPLILYNGNLIFCEAYPSREVLKNLLNIKMDPSIFSESVRELVAIGASIASNCDACFKYHYKEAIRLGISNEDIRQAVDMAQKVKESPAKSILSLAGKILGDVQVDQTQNCCDDNKSSAEKCCG